MRLLAFTNLFPNAAEPARGLFNLQAFQALAEHCEALRVVAPVRILPRRLRCGDPDTPVPPREQIGGLAVDHPRYFLLPRIGVGTQGVQMLVSLTRELERIAVEFLPDAVFGTWAFPDLVAAAALAGRWRLPLAAKVHGADINVFTYHPARRRKIVRALHQARLVLSVTDALKQRLVELGIPAEKVLVQRNGVDSERFRIRDRESARRELRAACDGYHLAYVGTFRPTKGLDTLLEAVRLLAAGEVPVTLHLVGDGPHMEAVLREQVRAAGIEARVRFEGYQPHERVPDWLAAADVLCLPSSSDGCPNIILEALACGRPVVASRVGGIPEILGPESGALVEPGQPAELAAALRQALERAWDPETLRATVLERSWARNAAELYRALLERCSPARARENGRGAARAAEVGQ